MVCLAVGRKKNEKKNEGCKLPLNPSEDKGTASAVVVVVLLSELDRISFNSEDLRSSLKHYGRIKFHCLHLS